MATNQLCVDPLRVFVVSFDSLIVLVVVAVLEEGEVARVAELEAAHHKVDVVAYLEVVDREEEVESLDTAGVAVESAEERDVDVAGAVELEVAEVVREPLVLAVVRGLAGRSYRLRDP